MAMTFRSGEAQALRRRTGMRARRRRDIWNVGFWVRGMREQILDVGIWVLDAIQNLKFPLGFMDCVLLVLCFCGLYECCRGDGFG